MTDNKHPTYKEIVKKAMKDPSRDYEDYLVAAEGIEAVLEAKIATQREKYIVAMKAFGEADKTMTLLAGVDNDHHEDFNKDYQSLTAVIHDLYAEIDEIVPVSVFPSSLIDAGDATDDQAAEDYISSLDGLSFKETLDFAQKQEQLKKALKDRNTVEEFFELHKKQHPKIVAREQAKKDEAAQNLANELNALHALVNMRSPSMKKRIEDYKANPDAFEGKSHEEYLAIREAQKAMAIAYEHGASDDEAADIWGSEFVANMYDGEDNAQLVDFAFEQDEKVAAQEEENRKLLEENARFRAENEAQAQRLKKLSNDALKRGNKEAAKVVREKKVWKELLPHPKDKKHFRIAKKFLNKMKPLGSTIEILIDDYNWKGEFYNHPRRQLALRSGKLVEGTKFTAYVDEHLMGNTFRCFIEDENNTPVVLGLQESVSVGGKGKFAFGTAFYTRPDIWTQEYEQNEELHGVPANVANRADLTPEALAEYFKVLLAHLPTHQDK